jgi:hypothetical protein
MATFAILCENRMLCQQEFYPHVAVSLAQRDSSRLLSQLSGGRSAMQWLATLRRQFQLVVCRAALTHNILRSIIIFNIPV